MSTKDNEQIYDSKIAPLMTEIISICKDNGIPMFCTFNYADDQFCTTELSQNLWYEETEDGLTIKRLHRALFQNQTLMATFITKEDK